MNINQEQHEANARFAASAAVDYQDYQRWLQDGADEDDTQEPEVVAVSELPAPMFDLLGQIAASGTDHTSRAIFATSLNPSVLQELAACLRRDTDDETDPRNPALRPRPRRKGRGLENDW